MKSFFSRQIQQDECYFCCPSNDCVELSVSIFDENMPPNTPWSQINTKTQIKLNPRETEWKNLMQECLINTEICNENGFNCFSCIPLDPNVIMDVRHEIARIHDFSKSCPPPKEKIKSEAAKLLREENRKKLLNQKEEKLITKEIIRLKGILENNRLITQKFVEEKPKTSAVMQKRSKIRKRSPSCGGVCEVDIWQSKSVRMTMETKLSDSGIPLDVKVRMQRKEESEEEEEETGWSEPFSCRKGSPAEEADGGECTISESKVSGKNEEAQERRVEEEPERTHDVLMWPSAGTSISNKRKMQLAWKVWRICTLNGRKRKQEKATYENKIEGFFSKLEEKASQIKDRPKRHTTRKPDAVEKARTAVAVSHLQRQINQVKTQEKAQKLRELVKDIKASQKEAAERLLSYNPKPAEHKEKNSQDRNFLRRMEIRREERNNRWREIRERKLKLEEEKAKKEKEMKEAMKAEEEKEKKRKAEELKEKRRLEREKIEDARREREKFKARLILAENHRGKLLLRAYGLRPWLSLLKLRRMQGEQAGAFGDERLRRRAFGTWRANAREAVEAKEKKADKLLSRRHLMIWAGVRTKRLRQWQVAVDWEEFRLTERMFRWWMKFTQKEQLAGLEKEEVADFHNQMKLKSKYLKIWQNYPELRRLEAAKETRKRFWRQRVLEIIPDYQPVRVFDES